jgi:hypothetical protein
MLLDATQTLAQEVIETLSPRKTRFVEVDPLVKPSVGSTSITSTVLNMLPSYLTSMWSSGDDRTNVHAERGAQVTQTLQQGGTAASINTRKAAPPVYGGAYSTTPYRIPRPNHIEISDFPSPSRTPYNPVPPRRKD